MYLTKHQECNENIEGFFFKKELFKVRNLMLIDNHKKWHLAKIKTCSKLILYRSGEEAAQSKSQDQ